MAKIKNSSISYNELFFGNNEFILEDFKCKKCKIKHTKLEQKVLYEFSNYLIMRIELVMPKTNVFCNIEVTEFDSDCVRILGNNDIFKVLSAIEFYPFDEKNATSGGHYTILLRHLDKWIYISDQDAYVQESFKTNLRNIFILFLEKL